MKSLFRIALVTCAVMSFFAESSARADGCYTCGSGSEPQCKDYGGDRASMYDTERLAAAPLANLLEQRRGLADL